MADKHTLFHTSRLSRRNAKKNIAGQCPRALSRRPPCSVLFGKGSGYAETVRRSNLPPFLQ